MAMRLPPPYSSYPHSFRNHIATTLRPIIKPSFTPPFTIHCSAAAAGRLLSPISSLSHLKPYLQSEWQPILSGWLCSSVSVYCLSKLVPAIGEFSTLMSPADAAKLKERSFILGALLSVRLISNYLQQAFLWTAALSSACKIRVFVFRKVLQRELGFFEGEGAVASGDVAYRITAEASDVADTVYSLLNTIVPCTLQLIAMATQMLVISPGLSLISALVIPLMALVIGYLGEKLRNVSNQAHLTIAQLSAYLNEVLPSILFVKANNAESYEISRFQSLALDDLSASLEKKRLKAFIPQLVQAVYFGILFTFCASSLMISRGSFDCSAMVSFVTSLVLLIQPIQDVGKAYNELKQGEPAIQRLFSLTRFESKANDKQNAVNLGSVAGEVSFSDVSFRYGDNRPLILEGVNFRIKAGQTVALVGPSGGGKTTIVKLLLRLYDPLRGTIQIDGYDIRSIQLDSLRRHVGLVSQDITLFSGTIAENIGYRDRMAGIDMDRVELAARTANADEFIGSLPDGYETNVGPRGSVFSGGQKQRIAIARALYQDPSILVLDEATSALDSRSELLVRQALQRLMHNRTVLIIAHRLETVLMAQRVFLLDNRRLQEIPRSSLLDSRQHGLIC
ncbi:ABC transporter B family member 29, chloroplastic [Ipomoea triloba]|uniref:ABC transporter B family member 29, chloroplastic n=1 Tax=Ipomoea triloba TaxID=35885 RepID=UPI00125E6636|nr:ABC transporter B family member 29, chloroplastic [Ipomoea triloba]